VLQLLAFLRVPDPRALDVGNVKEDVLRAVIGLEEAVAFGRVEPLHGADGHGDAPFMTECRPRGCRAADQASRGNRHRARRSITSEEGRPDRTSFTQGIWRM